MCTLSYSSHKREDNNLFLSRGPDYLVKQFAPDLWSQEDKEGFIQLL